MRSHIRCASTGIALCALTLLTTISPLGGQTSTGRLEGTVQDESGAVVPGAKVIVTNNRTQVTLQTNTSNQGFFIFAALPNSTYTLTIEAAGFSKGIISNIEVNASATTVQNVKMEVGSVAETVTVEAATERVNTADAMVSRSVTLRDIDVLPQLGRGPLALAIFQPGMSIQPGSDSFTRVNGTRQGSNNAKLDGIDANDAVVPRFGLSLTSVNTDSVEEMRVVTNGGKAEYGRNAGGQIEMITRSGTNRWSGNAFEYLRNTKLNANPFFSNSSGIERPKFIQNIFGGSFGGPILKDRTFVFGNYQGRRTSQDVVRNRTVLTPEAKAGIFRWTTPGSSALQSFNIVLNDPRGKGIDPVVAASLAQVPDPNNGDVGDGLNTSGFRFNSPGGSYEDQFTIKADHNLWSGHRVFYRHSWQRNSFIDTLNNAEQRYPGLPHGTQGGTRWGYSIGSDWAIQPALVNEFRIGYQSASVAFERVRPKEAVVIPNLYTAPYFTGFPQGRNSPVIDLTDNITKISGKHTSKAGITFRRVLQYGYNDAGIYPNINVARASGNIPPSSIGPSGSAIISSADRQRFENLYNDLLGRVSSITTTFYSDLNEFQPAGVGRIRNTVLKDYGLFLQDDWKLLPNLTLNVGLRWELMSAPSERDGIQGTLDKAAQINSIARINDFSVRQSNDWYDNDYNNFAPRIGFAWDPFRDGKTSIRGGYGVFYDRIIGATTSAVDGATPGFSQGVTVFPNTAAGSDVRVSDNPAFPAQPDAPVLTQPVDRQASIYVFQPNLRTGYVQHFDFNIQREVLRNTIVDIGYVRTFGIKLFTWLDLDQPRVYGDFLSAFREIEAFRASGAAPSAGNTLVRLFGTPQAAVSAIGASTFQNGLLNSAANTVDRNNYSRYGNASLDDFYLRNFPQYNLLRFGTNDGWSHYNSLQISVRRSTGALRFIANYTFSKLLDNSSVDGNGFTAPYDSFNLNLNRGRGDFDHPHSFNGNVIYTLPIGTGHVLGGDMPKWANTLAGGWELGSLFIWQSGTVFSVSSGRATGPSTATTSADYSGDRNIGAVDRRGDGVYFLSENQAAQFSFPEAGTIGTSGRNAFRGPRYFNVDLSVVKRFALTEHHAVTFRAEAYNLFNNSNFSNPSVTLTTPQTFGRISSTVGSARIFQMALRYDF